MEAQSCQSYQLNMFPIYMHLFQCLQLVQLLKPCTVGFIVSDCIYLHISHVSCPSRSINYS